MCAQVGSAEIDKCAVGRGCISRVIVMDDCKKSVYGIACSCPGFRPELIRCERVVRCCVLGEGVS